MSSIHTCALESIFVEVVTSVRSSSVIHPMRKRCRSIPVCMARSRCTTWCLFMARLKSPTPCWLVVATCSAMYKARLVWLAEDGVAMMTRSAPCNPPMKVSRFWKPVGTPLMFLPCAYGARPGSDSCRDHARQTAGPSLGFVVTFLSIPTPTRPSACETIASKR